MTQQTLVPPGRLGALLIEQRTRTAKSVSDLASQSSLFSASDLDRIERGAATLTDADVDAVMGLYGVDLSAGTYGRSELVIDLQRGEIGVGATALRFEGATADAVLERYVSLLYLLREQPVGVRLPLRANDLHTLGHTLDRPESRLVSDIHDIMSDRRTVGRTRRMSARRRVLKAGLLVGATVAGALIMVGDVIPDAAASPATPEDRGSAVLAQTDFDVTQALPDWSVDWADDHPVYGGLTNANHRSITVHVDPAWDDERLLDIAMHEVGHAIDLEYLDDGARSEWMRLRGLDNSTPWWAVSGHQDFAVGAGDFAEAFASAVAGTPSDSEHGDFTPEQLDFVRDILERIQSSESETSR